MANLSQLGKAIGSYFVSRTIRGSHGLPLLRESPRLFSTEGKQPSTDPAVDTFFETSKTGLAYGKLFGITRNTLKTDIVNLLEGCNLALDDVKVEYNRNFTPTSMLVQFPSQQAYDNAFRVIGRKGRLYRLERADRSQWDLLSPYNGKTVLLLGLHRMAMQDDVERFLSGCNYDASSVNIFLRAAVPEPVKMATVLFPSPTQAMHAFLTKNRGFCQNNQILMRVLQ